MASWEALVARSAAMDVSLILSSCEICIYRVSQVALREAHGGWHLSLAMVLMVHLGRLLGDVFL